MLLCVYNYKFKHVLQFCMHFPQDSILNLENLDLAEQDFAD